MKIPGHFLARKALKPAKKKLERLLDG